MNVLIITPFYMPDVGGSSRLLSDIADGLTGRGHQVEVLTYGPATPEAARRYGEYDRSRAYRMNRVPPSRWPGMSSLALLRELVNRTATGQVDLVICGVAYPAAVLAWINSLVTGTPFVVYSHGEDVTCVDRSRSTRIALTTAIKRARLTMTNSRFTLDRVRALGVDPNRIVWCPPWIDPEPYENVDPERASELRRELGLEGRRIILTLARLAERKGHDTVIQALPDIVRHAPDAHYLVVGKGDPSRLRALAQKNRVNDRLTVIEEVGDADLAPLFQLADVHVMVSRWDREVREVEGFGIVYLEAASCGRPSVAGNAGGSPDAVEHGVTGLIVDPEAPEEVADAVSILLTDRWLAAAMGASGRERVRECFQKSVALDRIEALLCESVAGEAGKAALAGAFEV